MTGVFASSTISKKITDSDKNGSIGRVIYILRINESTKNRIDPNIYFFWEAFSLNLFRILNEDKKMPITNENK